jgi:hypothetical protein
MHDRRPGCLVGLLELGLVRWIYNGAQRRFGFGQGGCMGCGCGTILLIVFILVVLSIIFRTDWFKLVQAFPLI